MISRGSRQLWACHIFQQCFFTCMWLPLQIVLLTMFLQELPSANIRRSQWSHGFGEFGVDWWSVYTSYIWCSICWNRTVCCEYLWMSLVFASSLSLHLKTLNQGQSFYVQLPKTGSKKRYYNQAQPLELLHLLAAKCLMPFTQTVLRNTITQYTWLESWAVAKSLPA